jgi:hypothetical protein
MITDLQIDFIADEIGKANIEDPMLRDDLIDHMCCLVEMDIKKGLSFDQAYKKAFLQTSPNGYEEIQSETLFLLNKNKIIIMKRITYISGFIFSLSILFGATLKTLHLPGAAMLLFIGMTGFAAIFIPLIVINQLKSSLNQHLSEKFKWIFGALSIMLIFMGSLFKIMHLPGAIMLLAIGIIVFGVGFLPFLFFRMYKQSIDHI